MRELEEQLAAVPDADEGVRASAEAVAELALARTELEVTRERLAAAEAQLAQRESTAGGSAAANVSEVAAYEKPGTKLALERWRARVDELEEQVRNLTKQLATLRRSADADATAAESAAQALEDKENELSALAGKLGAREVALMERVRDLEERLAMPRDETVTG